PVLDEEVAQNVKFARTDRTSRTELLGARSNAERSEAHDANDGHHHDEECGHAENNGARAISLPRILGRAVVRFDSFDETSRLQIREVPVDLCHELVTPSGLRPHGVMTVRTGWNDGHYDDLCRERVVLGRQGVRTHQIHNADNHGWLVDET